MALLLSNVSIHPKAILFYSTSNCCSFSSILCNLEQPPLVQNPGPLCDSQVVKEIAAASRDLSAEDSLYETVKELKDPASAVPPQVPGLPNGTAQPSPEEPPPHPHHHHHHGLLNGHLSPGTPERGPLCTGVEYASIDLNKKSRNSADLEARRRSANATAATPPQRRPLEEPEEEVPPPVPEKVLDENDNQPVLMNGLVGAGLHNGEVRTARSQLFF